MSTDSKQSLIGVLVAKRPEQPPPLLSAEARLLPDKKNCQPLR